MPELCYKRYKLALVCSICILVVAGCDPVIVDPDITTTMDDGPIAENISAKLGDPLPDATSEQLATFERGLAVFQKRFDLADGLGPSFNVTFCGACHERPVPGGSAGLYRNYVLSGRLTGDGAFIPGDSNGPAGGVLRVYHFKAGEIARPIIPDDTTIFAQRNPIPMFGLGLVAALNEEAILANADPDDRDGDGISGRPNFDRGFVGRFGRKAQTVSIEGFIRGPVFNHLGITSDPLTDASRAMLPVDSSGAKQRVFNSQSQYKGTVTFQAAAPDAPLFDDDGVADPELSPSDLFDLISFSMLLAAPEFETPTEQSNRGRLLFNQAGCAGCHVARIDSPRGPIPLYSDLLLHDMGESLADGIIQGSATGSEFRTQPLWGLAAVGPYLHDGRAETIADAILAHGGESKASRDAYAAFNMTEQGDVIEFLLSLGGRSQFTTGLVAPNTPIARVGAYGGPFREMNDDEQLRFLRGRELFDRDFGHATGIGALAGADGGARYNGDSCRACHFDPVVGGSGPRGVNVMRHGSVDSNGVFSPPTDTPNTILHKQIVVGFNPPEPTAEINVLEHRQTPTALGLGLIDAISEDTIRSNEDPEDTNGDGISGRAHILSDGQVGRLGWKAQVPNVGEFVRDAMAAEIGLTIPEQIGLMFGITVDNDGVNDPELLIEEAEDLAFFLSMLAAPPRQNIETNQAAQVSSGEALFTSVGCAACHIPNLPSSLGDVPLYSDLLLHQILATGTAGIEDGDATQQEFRTSPLWGISQTAPYFHSGEADTIDEAVRLHAGEGDLSRDSYLSLSDSDREALLAFLGSL